MHGMAAFFQSNHRAFTYHISGEKVNGKNYWLSGDEHDAIWYGPHQIETGYGSGWHIGPTRNVGELLVGIYSKGNENCPNETLEQEFAKYGEVTDLFITRKGFAFVTMGDDDGTAAAIR